MELVIPAKSPLRLSAIGSRDSVSFDGRLLLRGSYRYGYASGAAPEFRFVPEQEIASRLPRWEAHRRIVELHFENAGEFVEEVVRSSALNSLLDRKIPAVCGQAAVWVEAYRACIEHGKPLYVVRAVLPRVEKMIKLESQGAEAAIEYA